MAISLTERAVTELKDLMASENRPNTALRVWVAGGGCSGLSYGMALDDGDVDATDQTFDQDGVQIRIDAMSLQYMDGASVDYVDEGLGGFKIENPNATSGCGCGSSFSTEDSGASSGGGCGSCSSKG